MMMSSAVSTLRIDAAEVTIRPMFFASSRILLILAVSGGLVPARSFAQAAPAVQASTKRIEPGLETAVKWKWWVAPSDEKDWGFTLPEPDAPLPADMPGLPVAAVAPISARPDRYEVQRGDALGIIARKFAMPVAQLKAFNGLVSDTIRVGQTLKIPTLAELKTMVPAPPPEPAPVPVEKKTKQKPAPKPPVSFEATREMESVLLQAFLDREHFSTGPIDGNPGVTFEKMLQLYRGAHDDVHGAEPLRQKAVSVVGEPFTRYTLRPEDFRFIAPPKAEIAPAVAAPRTRSSRSKSKQAPALPPPTYDELVATAHLAYRTPWEFVAERFHCDETFLRNLNIKIKGTPVAGTEFQVPNVLPFEIEKTFDGPLQPAADAAKPVTAAIVDLSRLEIYQSGKLIAVMPMSVARPDLRGRNSWTVLDVIPRPRLATKQEQKEQSKPKVVSAFVSQLIPADTPAPPPVPVLATEQYLAAGPNNPLGILWINLAKANTTDPLPYGLHGTSIPTQMKTQESIGGLRLANWDIARAVRLLPPGTPLQWK